METKTDEISEERAKLMRVINTAEVDGFVYYSFLKLMAERMKFIAQRTSKQNLNATLLPHFISRSSSYSSRRLSRTWRAVDATNLYTFSLRISTRRFFCFLLLHICFIIRHNSRLRVYGISHSVVESFLPPAPEAAV